MPIASTEITLSLSGGASNTNPASSLGGVRSSTASGSNLFDTVAASEAVSGRVEYRCVYVGNADPSLTLQGASISVQADSTSTSTAIALGVGASAVNGTEQSVANETTAPSGVTFSTSASLGDIPAGGFRAVWERRTVTAGAAALASDSAVLRVSGSYTE